MVILGETRTLRDAFIPILSFSIVFILNYVGWGQEEHTVIFWHIGLEGCPAGPEWAGERGISGAPRAPVLHDASVAALHPPSVQTKCMSPLA